MGDQSGSRQPGVLASPHDVRLVGALVVVVWVMSSADDFWPTWPMLGWSVGLTAHAVTVPSTPLEVSEDKSCSEAT